MEKKPFPTLDPRQTENLMTAYFEICRQFDLFKKKAVEAYRDLASYSMTGDLLGKDYSKVTDVEILNMIEDTEVDDGGETSARIG